MILTVTPNPSLDLLYSAPRLRWDDANRIPEPRSRPGGQGINLLRALRALGGEGLGITLLGGATGHEAQRTLAADAAPIHVIEAQAATRLFIAIREEDSGRALLLNSPGPERTRDEVDRFLGAVDRAIHQHRPDWVACCGSLPPGFPLEAYAHVCAIARRLECRCVTDCDGPALHRAAEIGCDLLVPNQHEASRLIDRPISDSRSAIQAAVEIRQRFRTPIVAITLGPSGAVLSSPDGDWLATPPPLEGAAVGAGDAFLAALLLRLDHRPLAEALRFAVAASASVLGSTGTDLVRAEALPDLLEATAVSRITDR